MLFHRQYWHRPPPSHLLVPGGFHDALQGHGLREITRQLDVAVHEGRGGLQLPVEDLQEDLLGESGRHVRLAGRLALPHAALPGLQVHVPPALALHHEHEDGVDLLDHLGVDDVADAVEDLLALCVGRGRVAVVAGRSWKVAVRGGGGSVGLLELLRVTALVWQGIKGILSS